MHPPCIMPVTSTTHRALDAKLDWPFFDQSLAVAPEDRPAIQPMTEAASTLFWRTHVSANPIERHPMLLPQQHWLRPTREGPDWVQEFNATNSAQIDQGKVSAFLRSCFKHQGNERVIFVEMRESSYELPFHVFLRYWPCFLLGNDEGPFLLHPVSGMFAQFGPNGSLAFGTKSLPNTA